MMIHDPAIDDLARRLASLVTSGTDAATIELAADLRRMLRRDLQQRDGVTRDEYDVQRCVLLRTREKLEEVEQRLLALERTLGALPTQHN